MTTEIPSKPTKLCPTCGTRVPEDAVRCLVCGDDLSEQPEKPTKPGRNIQGSRMPQITLSLPMVIIMLAVFLGIGATLVYFALQRTGRVVEPTTTPTPTTTSTPTLTPTPVTPTPTASPMPSPTPFSYTVAAGDTCLVIAARFEISVASIVRLNNLPAACTIFPNDELLIPYPTPTPTSFPTATLSGIEATRAACDSVSYTVEDGDTLSDIATNYAVPMTAIQDYNGLPTNVVYSGMQLIIPLCERAATPGPSPTPIPPPPYLAPNLLLPADGQAFGLQDDTVTLQWASVGELNNNERYAVMVEDITEGEARKLTQYVSDTKFIVPSSFRANDNIPHVYRWRVMTVRQAGTDDDGNVIWDTAGAVSDPRVFSWIGEALEETPEP